MFLPRLALANFRFTLVIILLLTVTGIYAFFTIPRYEDPQVNAPGATILAIYPGANALDVEQDVINVIEEALREIPELDEIYAFASDGVGSFILPYKYGVDQEAVYNDLNRRIDNLRDEMPDELLSLDIGEVIMQDVSIYQIALISEDAEYKELEDLADELSRQIRIQEGVRKSEVHAVPEQELVIEVDPERLSTLKLSTEQVIQAIAGADLVLPGGHVDLGDRQFNVRVNSGFEDIHDIEQTIIHSADGKIIYLNDIAEIYFDEGENVYRGRYNGQNAVFVTVQQQGNSNIFDIDEAVKPVIEAFQSDLPDHVELVIGFDQTESVSKRINTFFYNLLQGLLIVAVIITLVVGFKASLMIMLAVPISLLIGLGFVDMAGYGLQQITIGGMVVALGLLVDNAIVVVENVARFIEKGEKPVDAAIKGASQVGWPIVSSTLTTILAFLPLAMIQDTAGDFVRSLPVTVVVTISASLLVALTVVPFGTSRFFKEGSFSKKTSLQKGLDNLITNYYVGWLRSSLRHPYVSITIAILLFVGSVALFPLVGLSFFPKAERPLIMVNVYLPEGSSIAMTDSVVTYVEDVLDQEEHVTGYFSNIGNGNPKIYYNLFPKQRSADFGQLIVELDYYDPIETNDLIDRLRTQFKEYAGAEINVREFTQGPPIESQISIRILGPKMDILHLLAKDVERTLDTIPGTIDIENPVRTNRTDLEVKVNKEKAAMLGVTLPEVNRTIRATFSGLDLATFHDATGKDYDIVLRLKPLGSHSIEDFDRIYVASLSGAVIPLSQVADISFKPVPVRINHYNLSRSVTVGAHVMKEYNTTEVTSKVVDVLEDFDLPPGYSFYVDGEMRQQNEAFNGIGKAALLAFLGIFAILVLQFRSFVQPFIIFTALPFAVVGSVLAMFITGNEFSFTAMIGLTSLIGIVVNDSIILVDFANEIRREGNTQLDALVEAGRIRFVPIILTSLTTIGGLLPLTLLGGTLWAPMGWTIIGGLTTSTFLILFVVPVLYRIFVEKNHTTQTSN